MLGGVGCVFSSAITLLVHLHTHHLSIFTNALDPPDILPCNITNEGATNSSHGLYLMLQTPISLHVSTTHTSQKSCDFVRYHQQQQEYPPGEVEYGFLCTLLQLKTRHSCNFKLLDFKVGLQDNNVSSCSKVLPYHWYPEGVGGDGKGNI